MASIAPATVIRALLAQNGMQQGFHPDELRTMIQGARNRLDAVSELPEVTADMVASGEGIAHLEKMMEAVADAYLALLTCPALIGIDGSIFYSTVIKEELDRTAPNITGLITAGLAIALGPQYHEALGLVAQRKG